MQGYLAPYFYQQQALQGYDPAVGVDVVGGPAAWGARALVRSGRKIHQIRQRRTRCGDEIGWDEAIAGDEDELGAADYEELGAIDDEIAAIDDDDDDDDDDELGGRPERRARRKKKKLQKKEKRAVRVLARVERKLERIPDWRRRKRAKLKEKRSEVKEKLRDIRAELRALNNANANPGGAVQLATPQQTQMVTQGGQYTTPSYPAAMNNNGVFAGAPGPGQQIELPLTFDTDKLFEATIAASTASGSEAVISAETTPYTYLDLQVVGVKFTAFLSAPLMSDGGGTPLDLAIVEQSAQVAVIVDNATVDGGMNMYPDDQIMNLGGPFGASSEKIFDGLRMQDIIFANGKCKVSGKLQLAFTAAQEYKVSLRGAVLATILSDRRVRPVRQAG